MNGDDKITTLLIIKSSRREREQWAGGNSVERIEWNFEEVGWWRSLLATPVRGTHLLQSREEQKLWNHFNVRIAPPSPFLPSTIIIIPDAHCTHILLHYTTLHRILFLQVSNYDHALPALSPRHTGMKTNRKRQLYALSSWRLLSLGSFLWWEGFVRRSLGGHFGTWNPLIKPHHKTAEVTKKELLLQREMNPWKCGN